MIFRHVICTVLLVGAICIPLRAQSVIARDIIAAGGSDMNNGTHSINGTVGQTVIGKADGATWIAGQGFWYRIETTSVAVEDAPTLPATPKLQQNYPNPFNPTTTIIFSLPTSMHVRLELYRPDGQRISVLINEQREAGKYLVHFEAGSLSAGPYICRLTSGGFWAETKMLLLK